LRLLLDNCVWSKSRNDLAAAGHDVVHGDDWPEDPGDEELLRRAHADNRVLVTLDKDFGELAVVRGLRHAGIVRLVRIPARRQGPVCAAIVERYAALLAQGAIVTVEPGRVRVRAPETEAGGESGEDASA
jgi:predicted nuclease of predicted toxin-antitoxin system